MNTIHTRINNHELINSDTHTSLIQKPVPYRACIPGTVLRIIHTAQNKSRTCCTSTHIVYIPMQSERPRLCTRDSPRSYTQKSFSGRLPCRPPSKYTCGWAAHTACLCRAQGTSPPVPPTTDDHMVFCGREKERVNHRGMAHKRMKKINAS